MKKGFLLFFTLIFIFLSIYGVYYYQQIQKAENAINESIIHIREKDYDEAQVILKKVLLQYDYAIVKAPALYLLADTSEKLGNYERAVEYHKDLIADEKLYRGGLWYVQSVISISRLYRKGIIEASKQQNLTLIRYSELVRVRLKNQISWKDLDAENPPRDLRTVIISFFSFNFDLAIRKPDPVELLDELEGELGFLYLRAGMYEEAEEVFRDVNTPVGMYGLAKVYLSSGQEEKGIMLLEKLMEFDTTGKVREYYLKEAFRYAVHLYEKNMYDGAQRIFENIQKEFRNTDYSELSLYYLTRIYYDTRKYDKALKSINEILTNSLDLKNEEVQLIKGYIYFDRQDFVQALKIFNDFIKRYPSSESIRTAEEWKAMCERSIKYLS
jgi:outer membrane protein assembly factor BamD (BamD/ComL family)